jgi:hypothetical protein
VTFIDVNYEKPYYFFIPKNYSSKEEYELGVKINELFELNTSGVITSRDNIVLDYSKGNLLK